MGRCGLQACQQQWQCRHLEFRNEATARTCMPSSGQLNNAHVARMPMMPPNGAPPAHPKMRRFPPKCVTAGMNSNYVKPLRWLVGHTRHPRSYANQLLCTSWRHLGRARTTQQGGCVPYVSNRLLSGCCVVVVGVCAKKRARPVQSRLYCLLWVITQAPAPARFNAEESRAK
jgi:hypothetical protein